MKLLGLKLCCASIAIIFMTLTFLGCDPPLDNALSPPIVATPIYECAQVIRYAGADRESKIWVYVNGTKVKEVDSFWGRGTITLPNALSAGDVISACQIVDSGRSEKTRDPVTVVSIPSAFLYHGEKIKDPPQIIPPLYECQQVVLINKVINGAEVALRDEDANTWRGSTPDTLLRQRTPELKNGIWLNAMQSMCDGKITPSDWSDKVTVQPKPSSLPEPSIREPVPHGSDTCVVDGLTIGTKVVVYKKTGSGPVIIGESQAWGEATLFRVTEPFDASFQYYARQALCEIESPIPENPITPTADLPAPTLQKPICSDEYYVTVCGTILGATVKVFADGTQVAQAAGNGECLKMALGDNITFATGQSILAKQYAAGTASMDSPAVNVSVDGAPAYNPAMWNDSFHVVRNNCYGYGCDILGSSEKQAKQQPGLFSGYYPYPFTCIEVGNAAMSDGLTQGVEKQCKGCMHVVSMVIANEDLTQPKPHIGDYHWYRLDDNGSWSHKPGWHDATDKDATGHPISSPETADRFYEGDDYVLNYSVFCSYYCVDTDVVHIEAIYSD